ncbi:MAG: FHA domain-containing protein, partial [Phycisphaerae bacterium]|nr:FHA domain-containing protein [Phycisphaerae bacterium]
RSEARLVIADIETLKEQARLGELPAEVSRQSLQAILRDYASNPYVALYADNSLSPEQRDRRMQELDARDSLNNFIANVLFFGFSGMMIAVCLGMAEPLLERNFNRAAVNGVIGAVLGLGGGVAVALLIPRIHLAILGELSETASRQQQILAHAVEWGILGLFIAAAPGVLLGSLKRLLIGLAGGAIGGVIGGALFVPLTEQFNEHVGRFCGIAAIGLLAGAASGLIESAVKSGWLKVTAGLIAGKQFVLYRNPTYIGAHPSCHIFLWKDPQVGKRHAAIHILPGAIELENLPLGGATLVNGRAVQRARLRAGDRIQIGRTVFEFHDRRQTI